MLVYIHSWEDQTRASVDYEDIRWLMDWDGCYHEATLEVSDACSQIFRVYSYSLDLDEYVETFEEAQAIIHRYHGRERRTIRRWRIPVQGGQMTLF